MYSNKIYADVLNDVFSALAHPIRRQILDRLKIGKATVTELGKPYNVSMPAITKHLKILEQANLISRDSDAQKRYSQLDATSMKIAVEWLLDYRSYWEGHLDRLGDYVDKMKVNEKKENKND